MHEGKLLVSHGWQSRHNCAVGTLELVTARSHSFEYSECFRLEPSQSRGSGVNSRGRLLVPAMQ